MTATEETMDAVFSPGFEEWVARGGYTVTSADSRLVVANEGGEIRYYLARSEVGFMVTRADRAGAERFEFRAESFLDVERYLTSRISVAVRSQAGLPILRVPFQESDTAPGLESVSFPDDLSGLRRTSGDLLPVQFRDDYVHPAVEFSFIADADPDEIRRSYDAPDGGSLFAGVAQGVRRRIGGVEQWQGRSPRRPGCSATGAGLPSHNDMEELMRALRDALVARFGKGGVSGFVVQEITEGDRPWLAVRFVLYDFWVVIFTYDRGRFGFGIDHGTTAVQLLGSRELNGDALDDLSGVVGALDERVRLRIPDKYLEWYERSPRA